MDILDETLTRVNATIDIINKDYSGEISFDDVEKINNKTVDVYKRQVEDTKELLNIKKIEAINWLMSGGKFYLYDDAIPGFKLDVYKRQLYNI